jgi:hypothetical protein
MSTTPKYNFPPESYNRMLPQRFTELGINSLRQVCPSINTINQHLYSEDQLTEANSSRIHLEKEPITLSPKRQDIIISAVDTSTIKIGETRTGIVVALRGALVWKRNRNYNYTRLGPFIFHITEENKAIIYGNLERDCFGLRIHEKHTPALTLFQMPLRLCNLFERWLQSNLSTKIREGLILLDGSLTAGTVDAPLKRIREILSNARNNSSTVLAFSKATSLRSNGYLITEIIPNRDPPYLLKTTGFKSKSPFTLLGEVYVARLNKSNISFRLDIDQQLSASEHKEAVEKLIGNDALEQGYPETLRLAHILCTFTATEVLAIQHFVARNYRIQIINRPDMHRLLFGPFGRESLA